jgi:adenylate cyclase
MAAPGALARFWASPQEPVLAEGDDERIRRSTLVLSAVTITPLALVWVITYWLLGLRVAAAIPFVYQLVSAGTMVHYRLTRRWRVFRASQLALMLMLPFALQWSLGGFVASSGVALWASLAPLGALMFQGRRAALWWLVAWGALVALSGALEPALSPAGIPIAVRTAFFVLNLGTVSAVIWFLLRYFVRQREVAMEALRAEREKSERLLLNVLPPPIAERLKERPGVIADAFPATSILFADLVGFTPLAARLPPDETVRLLDRVFTTFDALAGGHGLEKIKTIGDAYMVAAGIPVPRPDHVEAVAAMALDMRAACRRVAIDAGHGELSIRIGIDTGPAVAGVIGTARFIYDVWGDVVNTASRMESHGLPGQIQVTERVFRRLADRYAFRYRGEIEIKGKGLLPTWFLEGSGPASP